MYGTNLTRAQFDALGRLFASLDKQSSVSGVRLGTTVMTSGSFAGRSYLTVEYLSGFGNRKFHVDAEGNSAEIEADGLSELVRR